MIFSLSELWKMVAHTHKHTYRQNIPKWAEPIWSYEWNVIKVSAIMVDVMFFLILSVCICSSNKKNRIAWELKNGHKILFFVHSSSSQWKKKLENDVMIRLCNEDFPIKNRLLYHSLPRPTMNRRRRKKTSNCVNINF